MKIPVKNHYTGKPAAAKAMNVDTIDVLAFRVYDGDDLANLNRILKTPRQNRFGLIFLCGGKPDANKIQGDSYQVLSKDNFQLNDNGWTIYYLGEGKQGLCLPWWVLAKFFEANREIHHFILSDADEQIPFNKIRHFDLPSDAHLILPQRVKRHFGKLTLERSLIEDIENSFLRVKMKEKMKILDFQPGVFIGNRKLFEEIPINRIIDYKWLGDIFVIDQMIAKKLDIGMMDVHASDDHGTSTIFDYTRQFQEMLQGPPLLKMKELVDYSGIGLRDITRMILDAPQDYVPTLFKYSDEDNTGIVDYYINYIVESFHQVAKANGITL